jgi:peptidoglycan/LPS O-acetylase OafA/YrhL
MAYDALAARPYWPALDGPRAVVVGSVMAFHASIVALPGGGSGVDVFFVLSGFLITTLLGREYDHSGSVRLGRLYGRRALRLLPALLVVVAAVVVVSHISQMFYGSEGAPARSALLYGANLRAAAHQPMGMLVPMWSLSMEEQFYVLWPPILAALLLLGASRRHLLIGTGTTFVVLTTWHWLAGAAGWANLPALLYRPDLRADGLMLGSFLGIWLTVPPKLTARLKTAVSAGAWCGVGVLALAFYKPQWVAEPARATLLVTAVVVATAAVLVGQLLAPLPAVTVVLTSGVMRWVGRLSYSLYLVHVPVLVTRRYLLHSSPKSTQLVAYVATSVAAACLLHYCVERPFLRLKARRLEPNATPELAASRPMPIAARSTRVSAA